jgi:3',5'-cyclic AMP phosphodiesterase CpdA
MPLHTGLVSRRRLLGAGIAGGAGLVVCPASHAATADPNRMALLSDTHVPASPDVTARGVNMTANLRQVVAELAELDVKPAAVLINGDCAYLKGRPEDYRNLAACVAPLTAAGLPLHLTMGNHDDRGPLYVELAAHKPARPLVDSKHVSLLETPHANWFLLDSLREVDVVTGEFGPQQLAWLAAALDAHADKPAVIVAHHNPQFASPDAGKPWTGLEDTAAFFDLIRPRKQVKAYVFGHSHDWSVTERDGIHLVNLPPVAYVFAAGKPNGWVLAEGRSDGLRLALHTLAADHPANGERVDLAWRS